MPLDEPTRLSTPCAGARPTLAQQLKAAYDAGANDAARALIADAEATLRASYNRGADDALAVVEARLLARHTSE